MMNFKTTVDVKRKYLLPFLLFLIGFFAGFASCIGGYVIPLREELSAAQERLALYASLKEEKPAPLLQTEAKTIVAAAYVPKRVTASGTAETVDAEITVEPPTVALKYNGQEYELPGIAEEKTKFELGKLQSEVKTAATVDLTSVIDAAADAKASAAAKHFSIGIYGTTRGAAAGIGYMNKEHMLDVVFDPLQPQRFWGVGYRRCF